MCNQKWSEVKAPQISWGTEEAPQYTLDGEAMCDDPAGFKMSSD